MRGHRQGSAQVLGQMIFRLILITDRAQESADRQGAYRGHAEVGRSRIGAACQMPVACQFVRVSVGNDLTAHALTGLHAS